MPSDAYMEISHPDVWGETVDQQLSGRKLGAFEISSFGFDAKPSLPEDDARAAAAAAAAATAQPTGRPSTSTPPRAGGAAGRATVTEPVLENFNISKFIDKASPDLFLVCCKKQKMEWAVVAIREAGDPSRKPYLVIEFTGLFIESFAWDLNPGAERDAAASEEKITFRFETILLKYRQQDPSGSHGTPSIKGFNRTDPTKDVDPLPWNQDM